MQRWAQAVLSLVLTLCLSSIAAACTTVVFQDGDALLFARNFDWYWGDGMIVVNQRGISKTAFVQPDEKPATWTSEFGSLTFNQFGREMPYGGINEAGLVVEQMMLFESEYPQPDDRAAVNMLQWIQYQLDTCDRVEEVLASDHEIRLELPQGPERIHYLVCDAAGNVATIEFLDGKMISHQGEKLPLCALTNNTYQASTEFAKQHDGLGGEKALPAGRESLHRFARVAKCCQDFECNSSAADREYCFSALREVAQGPATVWSIVYDIPAKRVYLRTSQNSNVRWLDLVDFDFAATTESRYLDINAEGQGSLAERFQPLTEAQHRTQLMSFFSKPDVKQQFGDLKTMVDNLNQLLRTYQPAAPVAAEEKLEITPVAVGASAE
jgi:choloylglycine hydrolase